jgi:diguanylate cyclase (GGDEF)-like protein/PAS domain S-box-containing protein
MPMPRFHDPDIYRDILDSLQIGVSVIDLQQKIVFWSDGAEHITGYARIDVLGHSCCDNILLHCDQARCEMCVDRCPIQATLTEGKRMEMTSFIHHRTGHRKPVHTWTIPLRDTHGSIIGIIQTFEGQFAITGPDPGDRSLRARGCLDELTGLPNQAMMHSHLREVLGTFNEVQVPFGIIFLYAHDLGKFRSRFSHLAGNAMLLALARTIKNTVWSTDFVGRWTEDRFLVILPGCDEEALRHVSERLVRMTASATIEWWGQELSIALSMGLASAQSNDTIESIVERAQSALPGKQSAENDPPPRAMGAAPSA